MFAAKHGGLWSAAALAVGLAFANPVPAAASNHSSYGEGGDPGPRQPGYHRWMGREHLYGRPRHYGPRGYYNYGPRYRYGYGRPYRHYGYGYRGWDPGAAAAAGIIGLTTGAIIGNALSQRGGDRSCYRFRSYNPQTGTYIGYDGRRHYCP